MRVTETGILLQGMESFVPQGAKDAYRVQSGTVFVYIVPWRKNEPGRRVLVAEMGPGSVIPSFVYQDLDYREWRFLFAAQEKVELLLLSESVTSVLLRKFSVKAGLSNYQEEGFENSLVEFYHKESVKDDVFLKRGEKRDHDIQKASNDAIKEGLQDTEVPVSEQTMPAQKLTVKELLRFGIKGVSKFDLGMLMFLGLICALTGLLLPAFSQKLYEVYIPLGNDRQLLQIGAVIGAFFLGNLFFGIAKNLIVFRIKRNMVDEIQNAFYERVFHFPQKFFRTYESADLALRLTEIEDFAGELTESFLVTGLSVVFSLVYLCQMLVFSQKLTWIALFLLAAYVISLAALHHRTITYDYLCAEHQGKADAKLYQYFGGIEKIRMAGAEEHAVYDYIRSFSKEQTAEIQKKRLFALASTLSVMIIPLFLLVFYFTLIKWESEISMGSFLGFQTSFWIFFSSILEMVHRLIRLVGLSSVYERLKPILETEPENPKEGELPEKLSGAIEMERVSFAYGMGTKMVLNDICIHISPGDYVGIVGASGSGKSTLVKLLLGVESPCRGQIAYDGKNLETMNKKAFRQNLGVVLQNGKLISGSILENITIAAPDATTKDVERVLEAVGLKEDIAKMPMGLHTILHENSNTISGGQQQRILIARAMLSQPSILIFDEATSALDNMSQAAVCESLEQMNITRIVVAHRLSTIRNCDRIFVLQDGKIAEEGKFEDLMRRRGVFYELAYRQIAE